MLCCPLLMWLHVYCKMATMRHTHLTVDLCNMRKNWHVQCIEPECLVAHRLHKLGCTKRLHINCWKQLSCCCAWLLNPCSGLLKKTGMLLSNIKHQQVWSRKQQKHVKSFFFFLLNEYQSRCCIVSRTHICMPVYSRNLTMATQSARQHAEP